MCRASLSASCPRSTSPSTRRARWSRRAAWRASPAATACACLPRIRCSWVRLAESSLCASPPGDAWAAAAVCSRSNIRVTCSSAVACARWRPMRSRVRRRSTEGAGPVSFLRIQLAPCRTVRGPSSCCLKRCSSERWCSLVARCSPAMKPSTWWRWRWAPHHSTATSSQRVHQPSASRPISVRVISSTTPSRKEKISFEQTAPTRRVPHVRKAARPPSPSAGASTAAGASSR